MYPAAPALSSDSKPLNGNMCATEHWATLASALGSTDEIQGAAGVLWLSQLLIGAAEASLQAGQGELCCAMILCYHATAFLTLSLVLSMLTSAGSEKTALSLLPRCDPEQDDPALAASITPIAEFLHSEMVNTTGSGHLVGR